MSLADGADHAEEYSMAALFRRERQIRNRVVLGFGVCLRLSAGSAGDFGVSIEVSCVKN